MSFSRAFWITGAGRGEIREEPLGAPASGEVLVETLWSGVSRGTESLVLHGRVPESEHERMRAPFQVGNFPYPVKYGYLNVGRVRAAGARHGDLIGRAVFCLYPHQTSYVVPAEAVTALPPGLAEARAILAGNMETAVNATWDAALRVGDRVSVIGAGVVGSLVAYLAGRVPGTSVELVDLDETRAAVAARLGVTFKTPSTAARDADVVFHASGAPEGLKTALDVAGLEARIIELSWYGNRITEIPMGGAFHSRRLTLKSSQVGRIPAEQAARWTFARRLSLALSLLVDDALDVLIDGECAFDELPDVLPRLGGGLCQRVRYDAAACSR